MSEAYNFPIINLGDNINVGGAVFTANIALPGEPPESAKPVNIPAILFGTFNVGSIEHNTEQIRAALLVPDVQTLDQLMQVLATCRKKLFPGQ